MKYRASRYLGRGEENLDLCLMDIVQVVAGRQIHTNQNYR